MNAPISEPMQTMTVLEQLPARMTLLHAGSLFASAASEMGAARFGRVVAAQLAGLTIQIPLDTIYLGSRTECTR